MTPSESVCQHWSVTMDELQVTTRSRRITEPRQVLMVILNLGYNLSLCESMEGLPLSHSSVAHARKTVLNLYDTDKLFHSRFEAVFIDLQFSEDQKDMLFQRLRKQVYKTLSGTLVKNSL